jgi:hypothetical protein
LTRHDGAASQKAGGAYFFVALPFQIEPAALGFDLAAGIAEAMLFYLAPIFISIRRKAPNPRCTALQYSGGLCQKRAYSSMAAL